MTATPDPMIETAKVDRPRKMLFFATGGLVVYLLVAISILLSPTRTPLWQVIDDWWRSVIGVAPADGIHEQFLPMFFQEYPVAHLWILGIVVLLILGRWRSSLFFASSMLVILVLSHVVKNIVLRNRPADDPALGLYGPIDPGVDAGSFPSGHAMGVAVITLAVLAVIPAGYVALRRVWGAFAALSMIGMVWQRTLINAHWLSDTLFGLFAGACGVVLLWWLFHPWLQSDYARPIWFLKGRTKAA